MGECGVISLMLAFLSGVHERRKRALNRLMRWYRTRGPLLLHTSYIPITLCDGVVANTDYVTIANYVR